MLLRGTKAAMAQAELWTSEVRLRGEAGESPVQTPVNSESSRHTPSSSYREIWQT